MTANCSQYMILNANDNNIEQQGRQNLAFSRRPALPPIHTNFSPSRQELEEIAQDQYPHNTTHE